MEDKDEIEKELTALLQGVNIEGCVTLKNRGNPRRNKIPTGASGRKGSGKENMMGKEVQGKWYGKGSQRKMLWEIYKEFQKMKNTERLFNEVRKMEQDRRLANKNKLSSYNFRYVVSKCTYKDIVAVVYCRRNFGAWE